MRKMRRRRVRWGVLAFYVAAVLLWGAFPPAGVGAEDALLREEEVKAAFVFNFLKFVEWPEQGAASDPLVLCVQATHPLADTLKSLDGKEIRGRPLRVLDSVKISDLSRCQTLFLGSGIGPDQVDAILKDLSGRAVLTLGDSPEFCAQGGMIGLVKEGNKMRFQINLRTARAARLKISSKLLKLARHVIQ
ncbi:protein of unknown function [Desulfacinum hydrothermale DSM 13146]|uniref:YfiR family protein n=1 Tax=Desulfacinum hydrothermale DSM 13146 TaxID=1121390 RepID=A0A1W1XC96_9BACT|nr:YfiR family protein [Desulfacinum hydrothermale]SMC21507.1 protein of unknown function [Desulfacinum hydrothermale DSM 13146]